MVGYCTWPLDQTRSGSGSGGGRVQREVFSRAIAAASRASDLAKGRSGKQGEEEPLGRRRERWFA